MDLARDILDNQLVSPRGEFLGRVDGVVLELRSAAPPRVAAFDVGLATLMRRIHPKLGRWTRRIGTRLGVSLKPVRVPFEIVGKIGIDVVIDIDDRTRKRLLRVEYWLRRHIIQKIPGGGA